MAWTSPRTWVTGETVTAAHMNAHVRDNMKETAAATATTAGDIVYADGANSMGSRLGIGAATGLLASTGSAPAWRIPGGDTDTGIGYSDDVIYKTLANITNTPFPGEVEVTTTTGAAALVLFSAALSNITAGESGIISFSVSGASTIAASDTRALSYESSAANDVARFGAFYLVTVTPGSNTFTLEAKMTAGLAKIQNPTIAVIPL